MLLPKQEAKMLPSSVASTGGRQAPDIVGFCRVVFALHAEQDAGA